MSVDSAIEVILSHRITVPIDDCYKNYINGYNDGLEAAVEYLREMVNGEDWRTIS